MLERIKKIFSTKGIKESLSVEEKIDNLFESLSEDDITVSIGSDLFCFFGKIVSIIDKIRQEIKDECGFIMPPVAITENKIVQENQVSVFIRGKFYKKTFVIPNEEGITEELHEILKTAVYDNLDIIFTSNITEKYINTVQKKNYWLVWNVTNVLSVIDIKTILFDILCKGKPINNINYIFEKIGEHVLSDGNYRDCLKRYNLHEIANQIAKSLR